MDIKKIVEKLKIHYINNNKYDILEKPKKNNNILNKYYEDIINNNNIYW